MNFCCSRVQPLYATLTNNRVIPKIFYFFENSGNVNLSATDNISLRTDYNKPIRLATVLELGYGACQILASSLRQFVEDELLQATVAHIDETFVLEPTMNKLNCETAELFLAGTRGNIGWLSIPEEFRNKS